RRLSASLKRCPDTKQLFRSLLAVRSLLTACLQVRFVSGHAFRHAASASASTRLQALDFATGERDSDVTEHFIPGARLTIGLIGADVAAAAETVAAAGAERMLAVGGPEFASARYASDAAAAEAICRAAGADLILAPASSRFMRVLAGVAHRLNGCVDTHVTSLESVNGELRATRWHYRQRIEAVIRREARPWIVVLESGCDTAWGNVASAAASGAANVEQIPVTLPQAATRTV